MDKLKMVKTVAKTVVGISVASVVGLALNKLMPEKDSLKIMTKVMIFIGSGAIGGLVANCAEDYTEGYIDEIVEIIKGTPELAAEIEE